MSDLFNRIIKKLADAGIESPRLEARLLMAAVLDCAPDTVLSDIVLTPTQTQALYSLIEQRLRHKPLDKILGRREFYKAEFIVSEDVLSPRPDTEILVEEALRLLPEVNTDILDLGTGSGCIIESILLEKTAAHGTAVDISAASLEIARRNAASLNLTSRLNFVQADWFVADFTDKIGRQFDMIVSNPPYIPTSDIATLEPEVKNYDPRQALDGGNDGLASYRRIAETAPYLLKENGLILLESGVNQAADIVRIFTQNGMIHLSTVPDLNGIERCVVLQKP